MKLREAVPALQGARSLHHYSLPSHSQPPRSKSLEKDPNLSIIRTTHGGSLCLGVAHYSDYSQKLNPDRQIPDQLRPKLPQAVIQHDLSNGLQCAYGPQGKPLAPPGPLLTHLRGSDLTIIYCPCHKPH